MIADAKIIAINKDGVMVELLTGVHKGEVHGGLEQRPGDTVGTVIKVVFHPSGHRAERLPLR